MNRSIVTIAASGILWLAPSHRALAQVGFDGVITFRIQSDSGKNSTFIQSTRGSKLRLETIDSTRGPVMTNVMIIDGDAHTFTILMPSRQQYVRFTEHQMSAMRAAGLAMQQQITAHSGFQAAGEAQSMVSTGRRETVLGVSCDVYRGSAGVSTPGEPKETEVCLANGVGLAVTEAFSRMMDGDAKGVSDPGNASGVAQWAELLKGGRRVLKVTAIRDGQPDVKLVATDIDRSPPNSSVFELPTGYTEFAPQATSGTEKQATQAPWSPHPHYPEALRSAGTKGTVWTEFVIDTTGHAVMGTFKVVKSDNELFTQAVKDALPDMIFYPAEIDGRKVKELVEVPFAFAPHK